MKEKVISLMKWVYHFQQTTDTEFTTNSKRYTSCEMAWTRSKGYIMSRRIGNPWAWAWAWFDISIFDIKCQCQWDLGMELCVMVGYRLGQNSVYCLVVAVVDLEWPRLIYFLLNLRWQQSSSQLSANTLEANFSEKSKMYLRQSIYIFVLDMSKKHYRMLQLIVPDHKKNTIWVVTVPYDRYFSQ